MDRITIGGESPVGSIRSPLKPRIRACENKVLAKSWGCWHRWSADARWMYAGCTPAQRRMYAGAPSDVRRMYAGCTKMHAVLRGADRFYLGSGCWPVFALPPGLNFSPAKPDFGRQGPGNGAENRGKSAKKRRNSAISIRKIRFGSVKDGKCSSKSQIFPLCSEIA